MQAQEIIALHTDKNDEPDFRYEVGVNGVSKIERHVENYGDHGVAWFNVLKGERLYVSVSARAVAHVLWKE